MNSLHISAKSMSMALLNFLFPIKNIKETMNYLEFVLVFLPGQIFKLIAHVPNSFYRCLAYGI